MLALYGPIHLVAPANRVRVSSGTWMDIEVPDGWYDSILALLDAINGAFMKRDLSCSVTLVADTALCPCDKAANAGSYGARVVFNCQANEQFHGYALRGVLGAELLTPGSPAGDYAPVQTLVTDGVRQDDGMMQTGAWYADLPDGAQPLPAGGAPLPRTVANRQRALRLGFLHEHQLRCLEDLLLHAHTHERPWQLHRTTKHGAVSAGPLRMWVRPDMNALAECQPTVDRELPSVPLYGAELVLLPA